MTGISGRKRRSVGQMIRSTCASCGKVAHQIDGAMMAGYRPRCADCGRARLIPVEDVVEDETVQTDSLVNPREHEADHEPAWSRRERRVLELAGTCRCGGRFTADAPLRCPRCRSTNLDVEHEGSAD